MLGYILYSSLDTSITTSLTYGTLHIHVRVYTVLLIGHYDYYIFNLGDVTHSC